MYLVQSDVPESGDRLFFSAVFWFHPALSRAHILAPVVTSMSDVVRQAGDDHSRETSHNRSLPTPSPPRKHEESVAHPSFTGPLLRVVQVEIDAVLHRPPQRPPTDGSSQVPALSTLRIPCGNQSYSTMGSPGAP